MNAAVHLNARISRPTLSRRRPLLRRGGSSAAEFCGGAAADCAAVCCCCPCGLLNLVFLAVYKVPACICRRALRRRKLHIKHEPTTPMGHNNTTLKRCRSGCGDSEFAIHTLERWGEEKEEEEEEDGESAAAAVAVEKEMLDRFYGGGFWRRPSEREKAKTGLLRADSCDAVP